MKCVLASVGTYERIVHAAHASEIFQDVPIGVGDVEVEHVCRSSSHREPNLNVIPGSEIEKSRLILASGNCKALGSSPDGEEKKQDNRRRQKQTEYALPNRHNRCSSYAEVNNDYETRIMTAS